MPVCEGHNELREQVKDHEVRIDSLEREQAAFDARFKALCQKLDWLCYILGALALAIFTATINSRFGLW